MDIGSFSWVHNDYLVKQAEQILSGIASADDARLYLINPGEQCVRVQPGCKLMFMQSISIQNEE